MASESDVPFGSEANEFSELPFPGTPETRRKLIKQVARASASYHRRRESLKRLFGQPDRTDERTGCSGRFSLTCT
jgi:hypothetical protein